MRWMSSAEQGVAAPPGMRESAFESLRGGHRIPGVLWRPETASGPSALVLVQHGGSGHKRDAAVLELVSALGARGMAVAAIDGLLHGDRRGVPTDKAALLEEFLAFWQAGGEREGLVCDWLHVAEELAGLAEVAAERIGWYGLSMGTAYGMTIVARCPAIRAAVLGKWSATYPGSAHLMADAAQVRATTLFVQHWDDELFDRQGTLDLFTALATPDKRLLAYPGGHFGRASEELALTTDFLAHRLCA